MGASAFNDSGRQRNSIAPTSSQSAFEGNAFWVGAGWVPQQRGAPAAEHAIQVKNRDAIRLELQLWPKGSKEDVSKEQVVMQLHSQVQHALRWRRKLQLPTGSDGSVLVSLRAAQWTFGTSCHC